LAFVTESMEPVIAQVVQKERQHPGVPSAGVPLMLAGALYDCIVDHTAYTKRNKPASLTKNAKHQAAERIVEAISIPLSQNAP